MLERSLLRELADHVRSDSLLTTVTRHARLALIRSQVLEKETPPLITAQSVSIIVMCIFNKN